MTDRNAQRLEPQAGAARRRRLVGAAWLALALGAAACATKAERADQALIRGRRDPGAEALARVAGPGAPTGAPATAAAPAAAGRPVAGRGEGLVQVAQAAPAAAAAAAASPAAPQAAPAASPGLAPRAAAPAREGIVVAVRGDSVFVDLGRGDGAAVGQRLRVVRPGAPLVHPVTGESLGAVDEEVALLEVTSVADKFATARVVHLAAGASVEPKDRVVAVPAAAPVAVPAGPAPAGPAAAPAAGAAGAAAGAAGAPAGFALDATRSVVTQELAFAIRDLAVADLDGDGRVELIAMEESRLVIYRWTGRALEVLFEEEPAVRRNYVSVDAADLDGDGRPELVVNDAFEYGVRAAVLVQNGRKFIRHDLPRNHYFRIVGAEVGAPTLVGQRRGDGAQPFVGDVHRYEWRRGQARRGQAVWLPSGTSIFDFQLYKAADGAVELATLGSSGTLRLYKGREQVWASQQAFDGTKLRVVDRNPAPPKSTAGQDPIETPIPGRTLPLPGILGRSGEPVPAFALRRNEKGSFLSPRWTFSKGYVQAVAVDGPVTRELWKTDVFEGYVSAFRVADLGPVTSGVGGRALVVALDLQRGIFKAARSVLVVQGLH